MMTNEDAPTNVLILPNVFYPLLEQLDKNGYKDLQQPLRTMFYQLEDKYPGFSKSFLQLFIEKEPHIQQQQQPVLQNMNELTLKLEKYCDKTSYYLQGSEQEFHELNIRSKNLKRILSRIPDDINEKRAFLETIKEIASAIKKTLDAVSNTFQYLKTSEGRQALENEKKEFIKYSKNFSNTLKAYFRDSKRDDVYLAANHLLVQTDYLLRTIKLYCEPGNLEEYLYPSLNHYVKSQSSSYNNKYQNNNVRNSSAISGSGQHQQQRPTSTYDTTVFT
ncbi:unnamed protein product [Didymodactylos carnosus]|uniref:Programmed cell death protein 10 dimerisation domain-containing protein n=1 Tax=Didymodactylos carnosus TaxID=1234261 RepID=A0A813WLT3_9BILA|nr:unnamed protein product [Didymodactylos carnosus]CAF0952794.1 unnamed protein product [Didymodactylos carnosus]CAF3640171.1 unnamed protein product [Didymodactylos carnosus]CAF3726387.1 unnamed protein product [Didymodactylos carnosus]